MLKKRNSGKSFVQAWRNWWLGSCETGAFKENALDDALNSLDLALIYFDADGNLKTANCQACRLIPELGSLEEMSESCLRCKIGNGCSRATRPIKNLPQFISYVYDNSVDVHEQSGLFVDPHDHEKESFREIISLKNERFYLVRAVPQNSKGTIVELTDISMVKSRNDHLNRLGEQNRILSEAIQTSRKGVLVIDNKSGDHKILFANQALSKLLGTECAPYIGDSVFKLCRGKFKEGCEQLYQIISDGRKEQVWRQRSLPNGDTIWLEINFFPAGKNNEFVVGFFSDQTQVKRQEMRLNQTQKLEAIGKLAGGVAHDFNNILAIIEGYARMTESTWKRGEDISEKLEKIYQAVKRGSGLTRQLLAFGKHRISEDRVIDLKMQIEETKTLLVPLLGVNVTLDINLGDAPLYIKSTPDMVSQIIMNLSINARDAMPDGGRISIEAKKYIREDLGNGIMLTIKDTGIGMSRATLEKIFDPFFTTKEQGKGTGLGLSMVYGLIQQMGGDMNVDSVPGEGTSFTIWVPEVEAPEGQELFPQNANDNPCTLEGKTVVLAEDEPDLLEIMKQTLESFGMTVLKASNGNEALEVQDEYVGDIDFLLTDMVMPHLGGLELAELFREVRPEAHVVYMSGYPVRGEISDIDLPDDAVFMAKPIMRENLKQVMEQVAQGGNALSAAGNVWG